MSTHLQTTREVGRQRCTAILPKAFELSLNFIAREARSYLLMRTLSFLSDPRLLTDHPLSSFTHPPIRPSIHPLHLYPRLRHHNNSKRKHAAKTTSSKDSSEPAFNGGSINLEADCSTTPRSLLVSMYIRLL
jgi:hypothetical protein